MPDPVLMLSGVHPVLVAGDTPAVPVRELELPVVGIDDWGPVVRVAFELRYCAVGQTHERMPVENGPQAVAVAKARHGHGVLELRAHRLLDFEEASTASRPARTQPAFRFSLGLDEEGETRHPVLNVFNFLLHQVPSDRIKFLDHDFEAADIWGVPGEPARVLLPESETWTSEPVHTLPTHLVGDTRFAYRLGRQVKGDRININLTPDEDALMIAQGVGATSLMYVYDVYRLTGGWDETHGAAITAKSWKLRIPGSLLGHQNLAFAPVLVGAVKDQFRTLKAITDMTGVVFTPFEELVHGPNGDFPGVISLGTFSVPFGSNSTEPDPGPAGIVTGVDVLPAAPTKRRRLGR